MIPSFYRSFKYSDQTFSVHSLIVGCHFDTLCMLRTVHTAYTNNHAYDLQIAYQLHVEWCSGYLNLEHTFFKLFCTSKGSGIYLVFVIT